jgi:hypothetical protein
VADDKSKGIKELVTDEAKGLAVEVYKDGAKPAVAKVGQTIALALEVGLGPVDLLLGAAKAGLDRLKAAVQRKLAGVPADRLLPAPPNIAAPSAFHYVLLGDGEHVSVLRDMFENLLVASMDRETAPSAHPAFVTMISQLTHDEAWILKSINSRRYAAYNLFDRTPEGYILANSPHGFRSLLGIELGIKQPQLQHCISNLERLGILRIDWAQAVVADSEWKELQQRVEAEFPGGNLELHGGSVSVTALGQQFLDTCVRVKR